MLSFKKYTNAYRAEKIRQHPEWANGRGRYWKDVTAGEIKIFVGLLIYMGLYRQAAVPEYWNIDHEQKSARPDTYPRACKAVL
jgi:hypothetical protein